MKGSIQELLFILFVLTSTLSTVYGINKAHGKKIQESTVLRPGVEYLYKYKSQALSGIPVISGLQNGLALHCDVRVQMLRDGSSILQMEEVRIYHIDDVTAAGVLFNQTRMILAPTEQSDVMREFLHKPIRFRYQEGHIGQVQTSRFDEYWSINIKKGLLSLFQLKLSQKSSHDSPAELKNPDGLGKKSTLDNVYTHILRKQNFEHLYSHILGYNSMQQPDPPLPPAMLKQTFENVYSHTLGYNPWPIKQLDQTFSVIESDINGDCETQYSIGSNPKSSLVLSSAAEQVVIKVKNFEQCLDKNSYDVGLFSGMFHYTSQRPLIEPTIQAEYIVTGDRYHFLIKSVTQEATYHFSPYGAEGGQISTHVLQQLNLVATLDLHIPIPAETSVVEVKGLKMEVPQASLTHPRNPHQQQDAGQYLELIESLLEDLVDHVTDEDTSRVMRLSIAVRDLQKQDLIKILKKYLTSQPSDTDTTFNNRRDVLLETLMTVPTPDVALSIIEMIQEDHLNGTRAAVVISALSLTATPTSEIIVSLLNIYRDGSSVLTMEPVLKRAVLLGVGTLTNRMLNLMKKNLRPIQKVITTVENVSNNLQRFLIQSKDEFERITILKAMGNIGAKSLIPPLMSIIKSSTESLLIKTQAINALRKLAQTFNKEIQPDMIGIYINRKEEEKLRLAAFKILMASNPNYVTLQLIGQSLRSEPSNQIRTFVYTTLANIATQRWTVFELRNLIQITRRVIRQMKPLPVQFLDSQSIMSHHFFEGGDLGYSMVLDYLKSKRGILPDQLTATMRTSAFGNIMDLIEIGIDGSGIETLLRRLIGPYGLLKDILAQKASIFSLLRPLARPFMDSATERIRSLLHMKSVKRVEEEEVRALIHLKILDQDLLFWNLQGDQADEMFRDNLQYMSEILEQLSRGVKVRTLHTLSSVGNSHIIPTPMGVPLNLNLSSALVLRLEGLVRTRHVPSWTQWMLEGTRSLNKPLLLHFDLQPHINSEIFGEMSLDMRWIKSGVAVKFTNRGNVPLNGELSYDFNTNKISATYSMPVKPVLFMQTKMSPMKSMYYLPVEVSNLPFRFKLKELKTAKSEDVTGAYQPKMAVPLEDFGVVLHVNGYLTKCFNKFCPEITLTGKQEIGFAITPLSHVHKKIQIELVFSNGLKAQTGHSLASSRSKVSETHVELNNPKISSRKQTVHKAPHNTDIQVIKIALRGRILGNKNNADVIKAEVTWSRSADYHNHEISAKIIKESVGMIGQAEADFYLHLMLPCNVTEDGATSASQVNSCAPVKQIKFGVTGHFSENSVIHLMFSDLDKELWNKELKIQGVRPTPTINDKISASRYKISMTLHPVNQWMENAVYAVSSTMKHQWYPYIQNGNRTINDRGNVTVLVELMPDLNKMNFIAMTSRGTSVILGAPYLQKSKDEKLQLQDLSNTALNTEMNSRSWHSTCRIEREKVTTFDGVALFTLPHNKQNLSESGGNMCCEHLFTHDCSKRELFSVFGSICDQNDVNLSIIIPQYHIRLTGPINQTQLILLEVNGERLDMNRTENKFILKEFPHDQHSRTLCGIKQNHNKVQLDLSELGITVSVENSNVLIKLSASSMLHGQLCGLCGDFDYDPSNDMRDLKERTTINSPQEFMLDMLIPSKRCDLFEYKNAIYQHYDDNCLENITMKITRVGSDNTNEICLTTNPISVCNAECSVKDFKNEDVDFVCISASNNRTLEVLENIKLQKLVNISSIALPKSTYSSKIEKAISCQTNR